MHIIDINTHLDSADAPQAVDNISTGAKPEALLASMAKHGISAACTNSVHGVYDHHFGNRRTLELANQHDRLIPFATFHPHDLNEGYGELEGLDARGFKALRFYPEFKWEPYGAGSAAFRACLEKIQGKGIPVILPGDGFPIAEFATLSEAYQVPVVLNYVRYRDHSELAVLLNKYPSLHVDMSGLTQMFTLEYIIKHCGQDRVLFGSHFPKFSYRPLLNVLFDADISQEAREAVAYKNACRLFRIDENALKQTTEPAQAKRYGGPIIDVHGHIGPWQYIGSGGPLDSLERTFKHLNIQHLVMSSSTGIRHDMVSGNADVAQQIKGHPVARGYVVVNGNDLETSAQELDRYYAQPEFVGAKIHCEYSFLNSSSKEINGLMDLLGKYNRPVKIHNMGPDYASAIHAVAKRNPDLPIVIAHGLSTREELEIVKDTPNVYTEHCRSTGDCQLIRNAVEIIGEKRVLFGSDQNLLNPSFMLGVYEDAELDPAQESLIMYENAQRLYGL